MLRMLAVLPVEWSSVPSVHRRQLTATCNSNYRVSSGFLGCMYTQSELSPLLPHRKPGVVGYARNLSAGKA